MARIANYNRPKDTGRTLKQMFGYLGRHKWYMLVIALLVTISALASILGTYMLKPVINRFILPGDIPGLVKILLVMGALYLCGALSCYAYNQMMVHISQKVVNEIRSDLFRHTQRLPLTYFDAHTHGELMSRFTNDVDTISEALNNSFAMMIQSFITITGTITMLLVLDWRLSLIVMAFLILMVLFIRYNGKRSRKYFTQQQKYLGSINGFVEEMVAGQKVEKVFNHEAQDYEEFCRRNEAFRTAATKALTYSGMTVPTIVALSYVNYALSACVGGLFALSGLTDLGTLASYLVYVRQSAMPMNQFTQQINFLLAALSGAERIFDMMNEIQEPDEGNVTLCNVRRNDQGGWEECREFTHCFAWKVPHQGPADMAKPHTGSQSGFRLIPLKGDVRFDQVVFGYTPEKTILNGISLYAKPGQKIAFVGSTGAGKTTITNLLNRFYDIRSGTITIDGADIRRISRDALRNNIAMVLQDTHLFTGTVRENIRYGRLDATDDEVVQAAKTASAHSFITRLPHGYDTMLEGDGANLSQGQRQLLNIARAAISKAPVLILDEATSSVDTRTEKHIEHGMDRLMADRTTFIIAHRLSTVRSANAIMVLEHGEIIERGTHEELLEMKGRYYELYTGMKELD